MTRKSVCKKNYMQCVEEVLRTSPIGNTSRQLEELLASHGAVLTSSVHRVLMPHRICRP